MLVYVAVNREDVAVSKKKNHYSVYNKFLKRIDIRDLAMFSNENCVGQYL